MSERTYKILTWLQNQNSTELPIRQATLAEEFQCSRRTIGRALKQLKEAGLLIDLNQRHQNRCKIYRVEKIPLNPPLAKGEEKAGLTPEAQRQWDFFGHIFKAVFKQVDEEKLKAYYAKATWNLEGITDIHQLYRKTFDGMYELPELEPHLPLWKRKPLHPEP